ncbi:MAG: hypothetical protein M3112_01630 [Actinomycetia bacterium]|nr:hypothetical protein [Actinomycetes bacterium]
MTQAMTGREVLFAMIALVFAINDSPGTKGMYPILGGGMAVQLPGYS